MRVEALEPQVVVEPTHRTRETWLYNLRRVGDKVLLHAKLHMLHFDVIASLTTGEIQVDSVPTAGVEQASNVQKAAVRRVVQNMLDTVRRGEKWAN